MLSGNISNSLHHIFSLLPLVPPTMIDHGPQVLLCCPLLEDLEHSGLLCSLCATMVCAGVSYAFWFSGSAILVFRFSLKCN